MNITLKALAGAALAMAALAPASAQIVAAERLLRDAVLGTTARPAVAAGSSVIEQRAMGEWRAGTSTLRVAPSTQGVYVYAVARSPSGTVYELAANLKLNAAGELEGDWEHLNGDMQGGQWKMRLAGDLLVLDGFFAVPRTYEHQFARANASAAPNPKFAPWLGAWSLPDGRTLSLVEENGKLVGLVREVEANGLTTTRHSLVFDGRQTTHTTPNDTLIGAWQQHGVPAYAGGEARMTLLPGGNAFGGTLAGSATYPAWRGTRAAAPAPEPETTPPVVAPPPAPPVPSTSPAPVPPGPVVASPAPPAAPVAAFKPLGQFAVRLDRVELPREDKLVHVYLTLKNASSTTLVQAQGINVRFEDSDGVGVESGQALVAKPGYPELFGSPPPTTRPGGELRTKFVFDRRRGATPAKVIVIEGDRTAEFTLG